MSSSITIRWPRKSRVLPAERALASALSLPTRKAAPVHGGDEFGADGAGHAGNGNNGIVLHFGLHFWHGQAIKKPRTFSGGASVQMMRSFDYARTPPEARRAWWFSWCVLVVVMARTYAADFGRRQRLSGGKCDRQTRLNRTSLSRHKLTHEPSQSFRAARNRRRRPHRTADDAAWRGADAGLHAGRHRRRDEGHALARGARRRRRYRARQYLSSDAAAGRRAHRRARRLAAIHRLERPDADRLRRLPGDVAVGAAQGHAKTR